MDKLILARKKAFITTKAKLFIFADIKIIKKRKLIINQNKKT
jgi:hypothetical protein